MDCENGKGPVIKRPLTVPAFNGIAAHGSFDVKLTRSATRSVEVEGQANIIDLITTDVKNGVLHVRTRQCYSTDKPLIVHISAPTIDLVSLQGSGDVIGEGSFTTPMLTVEVQGSGAVTLSIEAKKIAAIVQGSGDVHLTGTSGSLTATVQGSGDIDADGLASTNVQASVQGSGDIEVHATGRLEATIAGSGDIRYKGEPVELIKSEAGSGEIEQIP